jgi:hypothetical protein
MIPDLKQGLDDIEQLAAAIIDHAGMAAKCLGQSDFRDDLALVGMDKRLQAVVLCATTIRQLADALDKEREEAGE